MIKEEFEKEACSRGYAPNIGLVRKYTKLHKKDFYTEADLIDCYRYFDKIGWQEETRGQKSSSCSYDEENDNTAVTSGMRRRYFRMKKES